jgi:hypothetical protein
MNSNYLEKWKKFDKILEEHSFETKFVIDDWKHWYYSDNFDGRIVYDIERDEMTIFDKNNNVMIELFESKLNELNILTSMISIGIEQMTNETKQTKIDMAIKDTKLRLNHVEQEIMLMIREKDTLKNQLDSLEAIRDSKNYE